MQIEKTILKNLLKNEVYTRRVLPFLHDHYFTVEEDRTIFKEIKEFILKYNNLPTVDALLIEIDNLKGLKEDQVKSINDTIKVLQEDKVDTNVDWLTDSTEKFCQEKGISVDLRDKRQIILTKKK